MTSARRNNEDSWIECMQHGRRWRLCEESRRWSWGRGRQPADCAPRCSNQPADCVWSPLPFKSLQLQFGLNKNQHVFMTFNGCLPLYALKYVTFCCGAAREMSLLQAGCWAPVFSLLSPKTNSVKVILDKDQGKRQEWLKLEWTGLFSQNHSSPVIRKKQKWPNIFFSGTEFSLRARIPPTYKGQQMQIQPDKCFSRKK